MVKVLVLPIDVLPLPLKGQGVDEVDHGALRDLVDDGGDPAVGVVRHPDVDVPQGALVKGGAEHRGVVPGGSGVQEGLLHRQAVRLIPEPEGVGQGAAAACFLRQPVCVGPKIGVQLLQRQAQNGLHLCKCLPGGTVGGHGQGIDHGHRREQGAAALVCLPQQLHGKGVDGISAGTIQARLRRSGGDGRGIAFQFLRLICGTAAGGQQEKGQGQKQCHSAFHRQNAFPSVLPIYQNGKADGKLCGNCRLHKKIGRYLVGEAGAARKRS